MTISKCINCKKGFQTERGLSIHFQHKPVCKSVHYSYAYQDEAINTINKNNDDEKKMPSTLTKTSNKSYASILNNDTDYNEIEAIDMDNEAAYVANVVMVSDVLNTNENESKFVAPNENDNTCNSINDNASNIFSFHNDDCVEGNLLELMLEIGAPNYAYKKIMKWAKDAFNTGYQFNPKASSYKSHVMSIEKQNNLDWLRPEMKRVILPPDNLELDVTCYDFSTMLCALLNNENLNQMSNLVVNPNDPFGKYVSPTGKAWQSK